VASIVCNVSPCYPDGKGGVKMDAQKFGAFVAEQRKEKNMTQADLAAKLQVTDKAVSRWERGLGFPDINTIEPLADALELSVLELMKSERMKGTPVSHDIADAAILDTLDVAIKQRREERKKIFSILGISVVVVLLLLVIDNTGWDAATIMPLMFAVILPLFGTVSGMILIGYGVWRKIRHIYSRQTFLAALICFAIAALPFILAILLGMFGIFPVPN